MPIKGSSGMIVASEHHRLVFIAPALVLNEVVRVLEKKPWDTGAASTSIKAMTGEITRRTLLDSSPKKGSWR
jgi:hypothetical protein